MSRSGERHVSVVISIREEAGGIEFRVWSRAEGLTGELVIRVGAEVEITDVLLRS